ncbi:MAG TPA: fumarate/nitrate reduction transcriptional regulator Fnr [Pseudomonadales bacterium]|nr:fumarate/nitrate reduction transcriptional regulator Fnr [Pseudomonadales bacterium]
MSCAEAKRCHTNPLVNCGDCRLGALCLPIALKTDEINQLDEIVKRGRPFNKGEHLYRQADPFHAVYAVRSGSFKAYATADDGTEQVTGFYLPGEILGMDGISSLSHCSSAVALETSSVCEIPFNRLEELSSQMPSLQHRFFQIMGKEITKDQQMLTLLGKNSAEERVAALLLSISARNNHRNLSATRFRLSMSRAEIGNYMGLTVETVSRVFSRLQKQEIIGVENREVEILDMEKLKGIANVA